MALWKNIDHHWRRTVEPTEEPVPLIELKQFLNVCFSEDDALIIDIGKGARQWLEDSYTHRQFVTATYELRFPMFPSDFIDFPRPALLSVASIDYTDSDGNPQVWDPADYTVSTQRLIGRLVPAFGQDWPVARREIDSVVVTFDAGYGGRAKVPWMIKHDIKYLTSQMYELRTPEVMGSVINSSQFTVRSLCGGQIVPSVY